MKINSMEEFVAEAQRLKMTGKDFAAQLAGRPEFADCLIPGIMEGYLRTCRSGGMPQELSDSILRAVTDAQRLGYFSDILSAPADEQADQAISGETINKAAMAVYGTTATDKMIKFARTLQEYKNAQPKNISEDGRGSARPREAV